MKRTKMIPAWGVKTPRAASLSVHRDDGGSLDVHARLSPAGWKQPGRRYGPSPLGPDTPKANKVTDADGNPRTLPMDNARRQNVYAEAGAPYGLTLRQRRRIAHKANHARAPFGKRAEA